MTAWGCCWVSPEAPAPVPCLLVSECQPALNYYGTLSTGSRVECQCRRMMSLMSWWTRVSVQSDSFLVCGHTGEHVCMVETESTIPVLCFYLFFSIVVCILCSLWYGSLWVWNKELIDLSTLDIILVGISSNLMEISWKSILKGAVGDPGRFLNRSEFFEKHIPPPPVWNHAQGWRW